LDAFHGLLVTIVSTPGLVESHPHASLATSVLRPARRWDSMGFTQLLGCSEFCLAGIRSARQMASQRL